MVLPPLWESGKQGGKRFEMVSCLPHVKYYCSLYTAFYRKYIGQKEHSEETSIIPIFKPL